MTDVVLDLGKTRCRARSGGAIGEAVGAPGLSTPAGAGAALASIQQAVTATGVTSVRRLAVGAAGALTDPDAAQHLAERLHTTYAGASVAVTSDAVTAHAGALGGTAGVVVVAGTGAVAVAVGPNGAVAVVDGLGPVDGDVGSGAWIGTAMITEAAHSGRWADVVRRRLGDTWRELAGDRSYEHARRRASLVPDLGALAADGDAAAAALIASAASALARTATEAADEVGGVDSVAVVGGLTGLGSALLAPMAEAVRPLRWRAASGSALDGAQLLLDRHDLPHERHVHRLRR
ncbi:hypothetical protein [Luteipulveratus halotolerans]|uniref:ATPase BadF/BadG/BcrA/BcrD type domain-containing protein n=1 Tax=Luteipulveratus halotolerans TaxID=1631356 RepID=A0A0L6CM83_9MICO|nr:hypothetical protein [Luteipulveratus halotolerans]KNX38906.1 hypothetical protein VV01_20075 [Luteipulveratus halotolerans]